VRVLNSWINCYWPFFPFVFACYLLVLLVVFDFFFSSNAFLIEQFLYGHKNLVIFFGHTLKKFGQPNLGKSDKKLNSNSPKNGVNHKMAKGLFENLLVAQIKLIYSLGLLSLWIITHILRPKLPNQSW
jgi:hypothetical protein